MATVLVVDDSEMDRRLVGALLEKKPGWKIVYAVDGEDALSKLDLHGPDVVVADLVMPRMNGLELVEALKNKHPFVPVVILTGKGSEEIAVQALREGAANYVTKRRLNHDLLETVEAVLTAARKYRSDERLIERMTGCNYTFVLDNDLSLMSSLVNYSQQIVSRMWSCEDMERLRVGVALEESLVNAYYHGNLEISSELREMNHKAYCELVKQRSQQAPYRDRLIQIEANVTRSQAVYVIRDEGPGFDRSAIPDPTDPANLDRTYGRGLMLMEMFMDEITFSDKGNEVTLIKRKVPQSVSAGDS